MIYTLICNPSLDLVITLPHLTPGGANPAGTERAYPGGDGIAAALMLARLGMPSRILGFTAGLTGQELTRLLCREGCDPDFIALPAGSTRMNLRLCAQQETAITGAPLDIPSRALAALHDRLSRLRAHDCLVISGDIPTCRSLLSSALSRMKGLLCVAATDASRLRDLLPCAPFLVSAARHTLEVFFQVQLPTTDDVIFHARRLQSLGARNVLVPLGAGGAVLLTAEGQSLRAPAPRDIQENAVTGDSMIAGFLTGWLKTQDYQTALALAVCAAGATAHTDRLASRESVRALLRQYQLECGWL